MMQSQREWKLQLLTAALLAIGMAACSDDSTPSGTKFDGNLGFRDGLSTQLDGGQPNHDGPGPSDDFAVNDGGTGVDTMTNEPCAPEGSTRACQSGLPGPCNDGQQTCSGGLWTGCEATIKPGDNPQDCTGASDDDCDGQKADTDPECRTCEPNVETDCDTDQLGNCKPGKQKCTLQSDGIWRFGACVAVASAQAEACTDSTAQNEDRDCDGSPAALDGDCNPCYNQTKDGTETDVDCGGSCPQKCAKDEGCAINADCIGGSCFLNKCGPDLCSDGQKQAEEADVDCGGQCPTKCALGKACTVASDCASNRCENLRCAKCTFNNPTTSGNAPRPNGAARCGGYSFTGLTGSGGSLAVNWYGGTYCSPHDVSNNITLSQFTISGSASKPSPGRCTYAVAEIKGDGGRIGIRWQGTGTCGTNATVWQYLPISGATITGTSARPASYGRCTTFALIGISGSGNQLAITWTGTGTYCTHGPVTKYLDLHGVETCVYQ